MGFFRHIQLILIGFLFLVFFLQTGGGEPRVYAQDRVSPLCIKTYEIILSLREPRLGMPAVWDATYDEAARHITFVDGVPLMDSKTVMALGHSDHVDGGAAGSLILTELNRRGRALKETKLDLKPAEVPVSLARSDNGYVAATSYGTGRGNARRVARLVWFNGDGAYLRDQTFEESGMDFRAVKLRKADDNQGYVFVIHARRISDVKDEYGVVIRLDAQGRKLWQRAYRPGIPNQIYDVTPLTKTESGETEPDGYIAAGRLQVDDGRMGGWAMRLGEEGAIRWQQLYPRGAYADFQTALPYEDEQTGEPGFYFFGNAMPLDDMPQAGWLSATDHFGEVVWQRYFRRADTSYEAMGLYAAQDGRINAGLNATIIPPDPDALPDPEVNRWTMPPDEADDDETDEEQVRDHIRILTLSPYGVLINDEAYIAGLGARGFGIRHGPDDTRVVIGSTLSDVKPLNFEMVDGQVVLLDDPDALEAGDGDDAAPPIRKGWVFLGMPLPSYRNPCL